MPLKIFNTLTGKKEEFRPINRNTVGMYNCGPTVYNYAHIGNMRAYVFADTLRRTFEWNGYKVKQIINITDVGHLTGDNLGDADSGVDRMEKGAKREGKSAKEIAEFYTKAFFDDLKALNVEIGSSKFPRATGHIKEQIKLIEDLERKGFTYKISDGIYFDTSKFQNYGKLGNIKTTGLKPGARILVNPEKKNQTDFALWKFSQKNDKREQEWLSPWGVGFPGWHIECSAMSMKYLGETFDVHTGGIDHIPTHHNNEIAQSESATGKPLANYWLHSGHLMIDGERIAKSNGNFYLLKDLIGRNIFPLAYRYWLLGAHYKTQMNFTWEALEASTNAFMRLVENFAELPKKWSSKMNMDYKEEFDGAINDDLNTSQAIAVVWKLLKDNSVSPADKRKTIERFDEVLGLDLKNMAKNSLGSKSEEIPQEIVDLADERDKARKNKDFSKADELRQVIERRGFMIKDTSSGVDISKKA